MMQEGAEKIPGGEAPAADLPGAENFDASRSPPSRGDGLDLPEELFLPEQLFDQPSEADDCAWPEDAEADGRWEGAQARRGAVKIVAWSVLAEMAFALAVLIACVPSAAREIAYWATMGQAGDASTTGHVVRANARLESRAP